MRHFVTSDGLRLKYVIDDFTDPWRAATETVLLVHAAMGSSRRFYAWVPHLARHFRVVRIDLERLLEHVERLLALLHLHLDVAEAIEDLDDVGLALRIAQVLIDEYRLIDLERAVPVLLAVEQVGRVEPAAAQQQVDRVGVVAVCGEDLVGDVQAAAAYETGPGLASSHNGLR